MALVFHISAIRIRKSIKREKPRRRGRFIRVTFRNVRLKLPADSPVYRKVNGKSTGKGLGWTDGKIAVKAAAKHIGSEGGGA